MKIEINPATGLITAEIEDNSSAASFVRELLSGHAVPAPKAIESKRVAKPAPKKITEHKDAGAANAAHKDHASATQVKKKQVPAQQPLRTAEALPPVKK